MMIYLFIQIRAFVVCGAAFLYGELNYGGVILKNDGDVVEVLDKGVTSTLRTSKYIGGREYYIIPYELRWGMHDNDEIISFVLSLGRLW